MSNDTGNKLAAMLGTKIPTTPKVNDPRTPTPPPNPFTNFFNRPVVQGLYYNRKVVPLDGYHFNGCRFDNCTLLVSSTNFELVNCVIDATTVIQYGPEASKIVQLFNSRDDWAYERTPELAPRMNPDGTITIDGIFR